MNNIEMIRERIKESGVIAILRGDYGVDDLLRIGEALLAGSVTAMEVTLNSPAALTALPQLRTQFGDTMLVGAGTVRTPFQVRDAVNAGAQFLVSPNFDAETVAVARSQGVLHLPGVLTPTEAQNAFAAGAKMLKLFPMDFFGPAYLKVLRGPLDDVDFVPTGGVTLENIGAYAQAGAAAVGMGSQLIGNVNEITPRAIALRKTWQDQKRSSTDYAG